MRNDRSASESIVVLQEMSEAIILNKELNAEMDRPISKGRWWTARIMSGLVILFMLFDSISKFFKPAPVIEGTLALGFAEHHILMIGLLGFLSTILYTIPRTSFLGAILLTAYFGGAIATHLRLDSPLFTHTLSPVYFAVLAWGGIWLRNGAFRSLFSRQNVDL